MDVTDITVVVPAHDEAELIGPCLTSLAFAAAVVNVPVRIVVVLDACTDETLARTFGRTDALAVDVLNVGAARAAGFGDAPRNGGSWYATTDADSRVPDNWLSAQIDSARTHDVFAGTVEVTDWSPRHPDTRPAYERHYVHAAGHRHIHGTSVGLSSSAYWGVGGFPPLTSHEDVSLIEACQRHGFAVDWSNAAPVRTSARHSERTPDGFASFLNSLERGLPA